MTEPRSSVSRRGAQLVQMLPQRFNSMKIEKPFSLARGGLEALGVSCQQSPRDEKDQWQWVAGGMRGDKSGGTTT